MRKFTLKGLPIYSECDEPVISDVCDTEENPMDQSKSVPVVVNLKRQHTVVFVGNVVDD